ncbi:hypothetical protein GCM10027321_36570 [Massilia terrae]|uniref:Transmembrane protein n=1 Tax=Massilia terrae TaxID=1811224 RepID=A0ABT2D3E7_9BURK|nr:hypothetical protein [Massilia terrae]MCS0660763.1 hypothetical protein [Massilia terrae]
MRSLLVITTAVAGMALAACSPKYNWRDYASPEAPYRVMFPGKPATYTRAVDLNGLSVDMTMTATEVEGAMYAVGTAQAPDAAQAAAALSAIRTALLRNIGATATREKSSASASVSNGTASASSSSDVRADGVLNGVPMRLIGHFESHGRRIYQVVVMGPAKSIEAEPADQFISSFKVQ